MAILLYGTILVAREVDCILKLDSLQAQVTSSFLLITQSIIQRDSHLFWHIDLQLVYFQLNSMNLWLWILKERYALGIFNTITPIV